VQKAAIYGIIAAVVIAAGVGVTFAAMSINNTAMNPAVNSYNDDKTRVIAHSMGETEVTGIPTRIVALDWPPAEGLVALGIQPIGVTGLEFQQIELEGLSPDVVDLGAIVEPNLETIAQLEPDLIIGDMEYHEPIYNQLNDIAPTLLFNVESPTDGSLTHLEQMEQNFLALADAVNRHDEGVVIIDRLHAKYEEAARITKAAGFEGDKFVAATIFSFGLDTPTVFLYPDNYYLSELISKTGLTNGLAGEFGEPQEAGPETFAALDGPDVHLFYLHPENDDVFQNQWKDHPAIKNLQMVRNGNVHPFGLLYGSGPQSLENILDKAIDTLTLSNDETRVS
jgi:ABC-type Fe3+-hydroxamate transport system substrate-binding protein